VKSIGCLRSIFTQLPERSRLDGMKSYSNRTKILRAFIFAIAFVAVLLVGERLRGHPLLRGWAGEVGRGELPLEGELAG
jgi:hypothetical protein